MLKKFFKNQGGLTFIEIMIAIALVVSVAVASLVFIEGDINDDIESSTEQVLTDVRYIRNLAISRTAYDFGGAMGNVYPPGGYGIEMEQVFDVYRYRIFADAGSADGYDVGVDQLIKMVNLTNLDLQLVDANNPTASSVYFTFKSENEVATDLTASAEGRYQMAVDWNPGYEADGYRGVITLGEQSDDGYILVNLGVNFEEYTTGEDPGGGGGGGGTLSCFPAGTQILMSDYSYKNIEDVKVGDYVLSYDQDKGQEVAAEVLELYAPIREHMCELSFVDSSLKLTDEHPFLTKEGWKSINPNNTAKENYDLYVDKVALGDEVLFQGGIYKTIEAIDCWPETVQTYTLKEVKDYNTFFAGDVVVHNLSGCQDPVLNIDRGF